jgi:hypothetical protein
MLSHLNTSLSGSIVIADYQVPLDLVRNTAHERLDQAAKDGNGRASLAIAVLKSGGMASQWVSVFRTGDPAYPPPAESLAEFARIQATSKASAIRLPYLLRDRFAPLIEGIKHGDMIADVIDDTRLACLIETELADSGAPRGPHAPPKADWAKAVTRLLRRHKRIRPNVKTYAVRKHGRDVSAMLVAQTLASETLLAYDVATAPAPSGGSPP